MTLVIVILLGVIAYLTSRVVFLSNAYRSDLADLKAKLATLEKAWLRQAQAPLPTPTPPAKKEITQEQLNRAVERININTISKNGLQKIPTIGATCAQRIIDARPYQSLDQLDKLKGVKPAQRRLLKQHLTI